MDLETYIDYFSNLHRKLTCGVRAPHKPILLLSIINLYEKGYLEENHIELTNILRLVYTHLWKNLVVSNPASFSPSIVLPMWRMNKELFWHLKPTIEYKSKFRDLAKELPEVNEQEYRQYVDHVELDEELSFLMTLDFSRNRLKEVLLTEYFNLSLSEYENIERNIDYDDDKEDENDKCDVSEPADPFSLISVELQCVFQIEYYTFIKNNPEQRRVFMSLFPSVSTLFISIKNNSLALNEIPSSFKPYYLDFLKKLEWKVEADDNLNLIKTDITHICNNLQKETNSLQIGISGENDSNPQIAVESTNEETPTTQTELKSKGESENDANSIQNEAPTIELKIVNISNHTKIVDSSENILYNSTGYTILCDGKYYRIFMSYSSFSINEIEKTSDGTFFTGERIVHIDSKTALFKALVVVKDYESIDIKRDIYGRCLICLKNFIYSATGDVVRTNYTHTSPSSQIDTTAPNVDDSLSEKTNIEEDEVFEYVPKGALVDIQNNADSCFDFFWILSIIDLMNKKIQPKSLGYEEIGLMAIANAWEYILNNPSLANKTDGLDKCIGYIKNKPEYIDVIDLKRRSEVFLEMKDIPLDNKLKNAINIMTTKAPYNILKAWLHYEDNTQIYTKALSFSHSCLYAIYPRTHDPYIELNPSWKRYILSDNDKLHKYFELKLTEFLKKH